MSTLICTNVFLERTYAHVGMEVSIGHGQPQGEGRVDGVTGKNAGGARWDINPATPGI